LDWRTREVPDGVWIALGGAGLVLGIVSLLVAPAAPAPLGGWLGPLLWLVVGGLVLEHLVPWDVALARRYPALPGWLEFGLYFGVGALVFGTGIAYGFGDTGTPLVVVAAYLSVIFARALFEVRLLYGGADAKALMVAGLVVPLYAHPWIVPPGGTGILLSLYPFAVTLLMNAAVVSAAVPVALAVRNLSRGEFEFPRGFVSYRIDVEELPDRFVWLKDPTFPSDEPGEEIETTEEDRRWRERQRDELVRQGIRRVWVTPQLPFVIFLAIGAVTAVVVGNIVFDVFSLL
jgi:preflagellin peptidase FlaK